MSVTSCSHSDFLCQSSYLNIDDIFLSAILGIMVLLFVSYNITCQWSKNLKMCILTFLKKMHFDCAKTSVWFGISNKHFYAHSLNHLKYSFNYFKYVAHTYSEGIEPYWSYINPVMLSMHEMSLKACHELMNNH